MTHAVQSLLDAALRLNPDELYALAQAINEALVRMEDDFDPPAWHLEILEKRLREADESPEATIPAEQVYQELLTKLRNRKT